MFASHNPWNVDRIEQIGCSLVWKHTFRLPSWAQAAFDVFTMAYLSGRRPTLRASARWPSSWDASGACGNGARRHIGLPEAASPRSNAATPQLGQSLLGQSYAPTSQRREGGSRENQLIGDIPVGSADVKAVGNPTAIHKWEQQRDFWTKIPGRSLKVWSHLHLFLFQQNLSGKVYSIFMLHDALLDLNPTYQSRLFLICGSFSSVCHSTILPLFL